MSDDVEQNVEGTTSAVAVDDNSVHVASVSAASSTSVDATVDAPSNGIPSQLSDDDPTIVKTEKEEGGDERVKHQGVVDDDDGDRDGDEAVNSKSDEASGLQRVKEETRSSDDIDANDEALTEQNAQSESQGAPATMAAAASAVPPPTTTTTDIKPVKEEDVAADFLRETFSSLAKQSTVAASAKAALSPLDMLRQRIERDRRDGDAWLGLIDDAMQRADLPALRSVYQDFFQVYPNAARQWQDYANVELSHSEFANVEAIFTKCLRTTPSTDLWRFYLSYTRRVNPLPPVDKGVGEGSERERVRKVIEGAYEFALRFIGHSRDAGDVWREYVALLKERETSNQWQAGQKMDDIRRTYQRAVSIPLANVEQIWREYDAYENGLNRITAKKFLGDRSAAYMTARSVLREMQTLTQSLSRPIVPRVPCWSMPPSLDPIVSPLTVMRDRHHVESWKKYLRWEESDPLHLASQDDAEGKATLQARIMMAYRKAVMHMRFYPELWFMASQSLRKNGREEEAVAWLQNGLEACAGSAMLTFAFVEQAERQGQTQECGQRFEALLDWIHNEIEQLDVHLQERIALIDREGEEARSIALARKRDEGAAVDEVAGEEREEVRKKEEEREARRSAERERVRPKVEELKEFASLVWIKFMHFVRRIEGQRPSRSIFARARKSKFCTWQVFEANALMEFHCSKDVAVATKVFELALKTFGHDEAFVVRYLDFLLSINDDTNARALFERTVGTFTPERARPIWDRWCDYEYSFGDSSSLARLDERLSMIYPEEQATKRLLDRNSYMDLDIVGPRDLGLRSDVTSASGGAGGSGGATAAERAVAASRDYASDSFDMHAALPSVPEDGLPSDQPYVKRARFANADRASATPPPPAPSHGQRGGGGGNAPPTGPRGVKRSVSPPSRFVPPPRGEPPSGPSSMNTANANTTAASGAQPSRAPAYLEIPDELLYFLDVLPHAASFDGPIFSADDLVECLVRSNLPDVVLGSKGNNNAGTVNPPSSAFGRPGQGNAPQTGRSHRRGGGRYGGRR